MRDTYITSKHQEEPAWFIIDASNQTLGRLSTKVSLMMFFVLRISFSVNVPNLFIILTLSMVRNWSNTIQPDTV